MSEPNASAETNSTELTSPKDSDHAARSELPTFSETKVVSQWKYTSPLIACRFDPTGKYVFTAAQNRAIQRWDLETGDSIVLAGHESWLRGLGFAPDGKTFYSAGYDGLLLCWNLSEEKPEMTCRIEAHQGWIRWLSVSPDGRWIATGGNDHLVKLWNASDGSLVHVLSGHTAHVYSLLFHAHEDCLLSGDLLGKVNQWDLAAGKIVRTFDAADLHTLNPGQGARYGGVRSMTLSPDGKHLVCSGLHKATNPFGAIQEPLALVFSWETAEKTHSLVADGIDRGIVWRAVYHPSGTLIGSSGGASGGYLLFWHDGNDKTVHQFKLPNTVLDMDLNADGQRVATVHHDRHVRICQLA